MRYARLGHTGLEVSLLALGCGNFGGIGSTPELYGQGDDETAAFALMDSAREHGITLFDTANSYGGGRSEDMVGRWLSSRDCRDEIVLTTKVRNRVGPRPEDEGLSAGHIRTQVEASLRRLRTDHLDLYLAHEPDPLVPIEETLGAFDELVRAGTIRCWGLSNYTAPQLETALAAGLGAPANMQSSHSLLDQADAEMLDLCARHGIGFTAYSPLAGGWLSGKYSAGQPFPAGSRMTLRPQPYAQFVNDDTYAVLDTLTREAADRGVTLATFALAWVLNDPRVTAAIVGPRTPEHLTELLGALDLGPESSF